MDWQPTLGLITVFIEFILILYSFKPKVENLFRIPAISILILLLSYQVAELFICLKIGNILLFSKIAFVLILWLPALGIDLILRIINGKHTLSGKIYYIFAIILSIITITDTAFVKDVSCNIFWAKYKTETPVYFFYSIYYELGQTTMIFLSLYGLIKSENKKTRFSLGLILGATLFFMLFGLLFVIAFPPAIGALPSVMCHFAIVLAIALFLLLKKLS